MRVAVTASPNDLAFAVIDFTNPASSSVVKANPGFGAPCVLDADGHRVAVGSLNGNDVTLYDSVGGVVHDGDLAEAILDRLLERGAHFVLRGRSYRTKH